MEMNKFECCYVIISDLAACIGLSPFWGISPRNSTSFTRPFLAGRRARGGHETKAPWNCHRKCMESADSAVQRQL